MNQTVILVGTVQINKGITEIRAEASLEKWHHVCCLFDCWKQGWRLVISFPQVSGEVQTLAINKWYPRGPSSKTRRSWTNGRLHITELHKIKPFYKIHLASFTIRGAKQWTCLEFLKGLCHSWRIRNFQSIGLRHLSFLFEAFLETLERDIFIGIRLHLSRKQRPSWLHQS